MGDWRRQGHAIRRREGAPSSHLDGALTISTQRDNNTIVATSPEGTSVMALSSSPVKMQVPNNPDLDDRPSLHAYAAQNHAAIHGLGPDFQHVMVKTAPDAAIYPAADIQQ